MKIRLLCTWKGKHIPYVVLLSNFFVREDLVHALIELKKQMNAVEGQNAQLKADNQRLDSEVTKQQHRIDKIMAPQFAKNGHLVVEIRKEIEKSVLVRQLKAQVLHFIPRHSRINMHTDFIIAPNNQ